MKNLSPPFQSLLIKNSKKVETYFFQLPNLGNLTKKILDSPKPMFCIM